MVHWEIVWQTEDISFIGIDFYKDEFVYDATSITT
jgi:hypothetical protein